MKFLALAFALFITSAAFAQEQPVFNDPFLDKLAGQWKIARTIGGERSTSKATARWVLNHQFLRIDMDDDKTPSEYEATVFIGWDAAARRYVVHWIDVFGGGFSKTLGFGTRDGTRIEFHFAYPNGPFRNTFTFDEKKNSWTSVMQSRNPDGTWRLFGEDVYTRR